MHFPSFKLVLIFVEQLSGIISIWTILLSNIKIVHDVRDFLLKQKMLYPNVLLVFGEQISVELAVIIQILPIWSLAITLFLEAGDDLLRLVRGISLLIHEDKITALGDTLWRAP